MASSEIVRHEDISQNIDLMLDRTLLNPCHAAVLDRTLPRAEVQIVGSATNKAGVRGRTTIIYCSHSLHSDLSVESDVE